MSEDEREALARWLDRGTGSESEKRRQAARAAAQLRADGERIKALEARLTPQAAAKLLVGEVLQKASPEAAAHRHRMIAAGRKVKVPHLTQWVRWALINAALRDLAQSAGGEGE